ncbi:MAG: carbohydrate kinase [Lachnospiraceae bacterium]|nr:carbohydrate kinase [Lachnospiraceae bacterium]MDY4069142.1 carbohydrate kinase [Lachnospiraceae bacterium]
MYEITALGESLIDFTPSGTSEAGMRIFEQNPGGAPANALAVFAKFGEKAAFIGKVGNDMHGLFLKETMEKAGIDTKGMIISDKVFTTLAFVSLNEQGEREFSFARKPGADTCLMEQEVNVDIINDSKILHIGSLSLTDEPCRSATFYALQQAKDAGKIISYDPNYRALLWESVESAIAGMRSPLDYVDVMKISDEETKLLTDIEDPEEAAKALLAKGVSLVAVTLGKDGAYVCTKEGGAVVPGFESKVVDTTGAGDSFWGGFLYQLAKSGKRPEEVTLEEAKTFARFGNAVASLCVEKRGGIPAMPTMEQVTERLSE